MSFYVKIRRLNGRIEYAELSSWLLTSGIKEVEYYSGGWIDSNPHASNPHLKFDREDDALAFILKHGGEYSRTPP